jgi:monothiol glutaredoxin
MKIVAYLKPHCGWSKGVRSVMRKYSLDFEDRDIINDPAQYAEMIQKSGQSLSPSVEINGVMLADVSGEEVENYLLAKELVTKSDRTLESPVNCGCAHGEKTTAASTQTVRFF